MKKYKIELTLDCYHSARDIKKRIVEELMEQVIEAVCKREWIHEYEILLTGPIEEKKENLQ